MWCQGYTSAIWGSQRAAPESCSNAARRSTGASLWRPVSANIATSRRFDPTKEVICFGTIFTETFQKSPRANLVIYTNNVWNCWIKPEFSWGWLRIRSNVIFRVIRIHWGQTNLETTFGASWLLLSRHLLRSAKGAGAGGWDTGILSLYLGIKTIFAF